MPTWLDAIDRGEPIAAILRDDRIDRGVRGGDIDPAAALGIPLRRDRPFRHGGRCSRTATVSSSRSIARGAA
jgi:hypothetical protein